MLNNVSSLQGSGNTTHFRTFLLLHAWVNYLLIFHQPNLVKTFWWSKKIKTHPDIAHPIGNPPATPTMKGIPTYSLLVKVARGCVPVRCVETALEMGFSLTTTNQPLHPTFFWWPKQNQNPVARVFARWFRWFHEFLNPLNSMGCLLGVSPAH